MTSPAQREFEAWYSKAILPAATVNDLSGALYTKEALEWAWQAALASRDKLRDAVIVLEDGAEPEVGDVVIAETDVFLEDGRLDFTSTSADYYVGKNYQSFRVKRIIQRNNKPVIYRSEL